VSNRGNSVLGTPGTDTPNITGFRIRGDGSLAPIAGSTVTFPVDTSPSQNLITPDGKLLFAEIFGVPGSSAAQSNTFAPFQIDGNGSLDLAPGSNVGAPVSPPLLLGSAFNPNQPIIYAGLPGVDEVGVFTYDKSGQLTFVGDAPLQDGGTAPCWCAVTPDGRYLYTGNTASDSIGVYSLADPLHPVQIQNFALGGPQAPPGSPSGTLQTNVFQIVVSPDGHTLYAIGQNTDATGTFANGNQLHILSVAADGKLSEPTGPVLLSAVGVPGNAHPQGIAVVAGRANARAFPPPAPSLPLAPTAPPTPTPPPSPNPFNEAATVALFVAQGLQSGNIDEAYTGLVNFVSLYSQSPAAHQQQLSQVFNNDLIADLSFSNLIADLS